MTHNLSRVAKKAASSRALPPEERYRLAEEIHGHLLDTCSRYRAMGLNYRDADRRAIHDLGEISRVRTDLGRAWRGRDVVLLPRSIGSRVQSFLIHESRTLFIILILVGLLRWQVVAAYHIPTKSMEPTLHGDPSNGDKILVNKLYFLLYAPERWQVAVFEKEGDDRNLIKRIAGLSEEEIDIVHGDLYVNGGIARKPRHLQDALLVPIFAKNRDLIAERDGEEQTGPGAWSQTGTWTEGAGGLIGRVDATGKASLAYTGEIRIDYPGGGGRQDALCGGDLVLRFTVLPGEETTVVGVVLREDGDCHEVRIRVGEDGEVTLLYNKSEVARRPGAFLLPGRATRIRFANLDDRIALEIDGVEVLAAEVKDPEVDEVLSLASAELGHFGGEAVYRSLELLRDIHYRHEGNLPLRVAKDHVFMLGDNSGNSQDSRFWGTIPASQLIGRPMFIFWPPSRLKLIR